MCSSLTLTCDYRHTHFPFVSQRRLSGAAQRDQSALCDEEDQQAEPDAEEPDPAGVCREGHPDLRREPVCGQHVLFL